ncbi:hypothetical protein JHK82_012448 [Glycine max]|nr:hypothetical protein JHK85_012801 [Glycine max]KAG5057472.1 hypothetical protein JHK86_012468 [Glycine max]KAG5154479.1 hypothetical protein JHK82_012448 [Glycine max]
MASLVCLIILPVIFDVDWRMIGLNPTHIADLSRLLAQATTAPSVLICNDVVSFTSLANKVINHLRNSSIHVQHGLSDVEFTRVQAEFGFMFPLNLHVVLTASLPIGSRFHD